MGKLVGRLLGIVALGVSASFVGTVLGPWVTGITSLVGTKLAISAEGAKLWPVLGELLAWFPLGLSAHNITINIYIESYIYIHSFI